MKQKNESNETDARNLTQEELENVNGGRLRGGDRRRH